MPKSPSSEGVCVLVVEDQEFQRAAMMHMAARAGATRLLEASDGAEALRHLRAANCQVDVVISDLDLPGMDGLEFIRHVAAAPCRPAVIVASAIDTAVLASVESMADAYGIRLLGIMAKPIVQQHLQQLLAEYSANSTLETKGTTPAKFFSVAEIKQGLDRDEFEPWFQPKVELAGRRVVGFEALARWERADGTIVRPLSFVPTLEQHALSGDLTDALLKKATQWCGKWHAAQMDVSVAVNVSVSSLVDLHTADRLTSIVKASGVHPRHVVLEITESVGANQHLGPVLESLARLRLRGFGLAIDDFGTGHSSVQQLGRVAFTELKIDRSFVRNAASHPARMIILRASLQMAREMKLVTVAEGVESIEDWDLLKDLGCDLAQGYLVAKPMQAGNVARWVQEWTAQTARKLENTRGLQ